MTATSPANRAPAPPTIRLAAQMRELARPWRTRLALVAVCVVAAAVVELVPPLVVRHVIDHNLTPRSTAGLAGAALLYLVALAAVATLTAAYGYLAATVAQRALAGLRTRPFAHLLALPAGYHDTTPVGDSISRATADVEAIDDLFFSSAATLLGETLRLGTVLTAMAFLSLPLTGLSLLVIPPLALLTGYLRRRIRTAERAARTAVAALNTQLHEDLTAVEVIRAFGRHDAFTHRFRRALTGWLRAVNAATYYNAFYAPSLGVLSATATALLLWADAGHTLDAAGITVGTLTAFVLLFARFFTPLINLGDEWQTVQAALAGAERVFAVLAQPTGTHTARRILRESVDRAPRSHHASAVMLENVTFGYHPHRPVLHEISLTVRPGEHLAIVGRTGAGKSSLLALLAGLYTPRCGRIGLAGHRPHTLTAPQQRALLGYVPQQVALFSGTVHDNLTLGDETIRAEQVRHAAVITGAHRFITALPDGYHTVLSDTGRGRGRGVQLSAGQRQLLALARAIATQPTVLLLDEATAVIDGASDAAFRAALREHILPSGTAVLTIAHRLVTARDADRVLVLSAGRVIEHGTPADLLAADGPFAALIALEDAGWDWQHDRDSG
jgi:ATP-binding cassette subfamily B protein